jgi:hypothetical protein
MKFNGFGVLRRIGHVPVCSSPLAVIEDRRRLQNSGMLGSSVERTPDSRLDLYGPHVQDHAYSAEFEVNSVATIPEVSEVDSSASSDLQQASGA